MKLRLLLFTAACVFFAACGNSRGDLSTFVTGPISGSLLAVSALLLLIVILPAVRSGREKAFAEED